MSIHITYYSEERDTGPLHRSEVHHRWVAGSGRPLGLKGDGDPSREQRRSQDLRLCPDGKGTGRGM
ncbi:MAG: hypothetical protein JXA20_19405 [Spirochaetes bacterium]|nr:hypothetical protein [Spirochaetota bacterium]